MSGLAYVGQLSIGALVPSVFGAYASAFANLQASLAGAIALAEKLTITPPSLALNLTLVEQLVIGIQAAITLGMPGVDFQVAAVAALIASLEAQIGLLLGLELLFGTAGIFAYTYDGPANALGPSLTSALSSNWPDGTPAGQHSNAIILATTIPATWLAMGTFFGGV